MNEIGVQQLLNNPKSDGTGLSKGLFGNGFKLGGGRSFIGSELTLPSMLWGNQNGPGMMRILGSTIGYEAGSFTDVVIECFAGPHDFANSPTWYVLTQEQISAGLGGYGDALPIGYYSTVKNAVYELATNYTTSLIFAAPFAAAAIVEQSYAMPGIKSRRSN
jgi:hypothetical protein